MSVYPVLLSLPVSHSREIGRIITHYAHLEWRLRLVIYALLNIGPKEGRIAVRETRAEEYVTMIEDLLSVKKIRVNVNSKKSKKFLTLLREHRNTLAHGIWVKHPSSRSPVLQLAKGIWQPDPSKPQRRARRIIEPEGAVIRVTELRQFVRLIDQAARTAAKLEGEVRAALVSQ